MMQSLNTAGAGMIAQQSNLDVISNNLANVNTTAFKSQRAQFQDLIYQTIGTAAVASTGTSAAPISSQVGLGAMFASTSTNFSQGALTSTGNPLDVAVNGPGFLKVLRPDGSFAYTRDGNLKVDANGLLVTSNGYTIEPPITIPQNASSITVSNTGVISVIQPGQSDVTQIDPPIGVTMFSNPSALERIGQNLYLANKAAGAPQDGKPGDNGSGLLSAGYLESSNVQVVQEMVNMIMAQRAYEINSKAITTSDQMLTTANNLIR